MGGEGPQSECQALTPVCGSRAAETHHGKGSYDALSLRLRSLSPQGPKEPYENIVLAQGKSLSKRRNIKELILNQTFNHPPHL